MPLTVNFDFIPSKLYLTMYARTKGEAEFEHLAIYSPDSLPSLAESKRPPVYGPNVGSRDSISNFVLDQIGQRTAPSPVN